MKFTEFCKAYIDFTELSRLNWEMADKVYDTEDFISQYRDKAVKISIYSPSIFIPQYWIYCRTDSPTYTTYTFASYDCELVKKQAILMEALKLQRITK